MTRHEFKLQTPWICTTRLYDYFASTIFLRPLLIIAAQPLLVRSDGAEEVEDDRQAPGK